MHSLHARIKEFLSGWVGGGGASLTARKQPGQRFFCLLLVLNLFYRLQRGSNGFITEKTIESIETHITYDFPGGGGGGGGVRTPYHPLWIRTWSHRRITLPHYMCKLPGRVKSGKCGHYLQIVLIQMRRLLHIRSFTICLGNLFLFQYLKYETNKVAVRN